MKELGGQVKELGGQVKELLGQVQACIFNTPTVSVTMVQSNECWVSLCGIMAYPHIYDVSQIKLHKLGQN